MPSNVGRMGAAAYCPRLSRRPENAPSPWGAVHETRRCSLCPASQPRSFARCTAPNMEPHHLADSRRGPTCGSERMTVRGDAAITDIGLIADYADRLGVRLTVRESPQAIELEWL